MSSQRNLSVISAKFFVKAYLEKMKGTGLMPSNVKDIQTLLRIFLLEKMLREIGIELNKRPDFVSISLKAMKHLVAGVVPKPEKEKATWAKRPLVSIT
jgi:maltose alpha-D-glucosyltransferase/alpha-amylase